MNDFTLIVPFYRNALMLKRQVEEWNRYPDGVKVICIDDGSPEPALPIFRQAIEDGGGRIEDRFRLYPILHYRLDWRLYRILEDKPWNREGARNLGAHVATTDWIVHVDIDHILPADAAAALLDFTPDPRHWYRFPRWRVGKADETRKKDRIPDDCDYGEIHPHVDSYLIRRDLYWQTGGYDEDYVGALGGGNMFLRRLEKIAGPPAMLPAPIRLEVYTRDVVKDASDWSLSRDKSTNSTRRKFKEANGNTTPKNPLRFTWTREL